MDKTSQRRILEDNIANLKGDSFQEFCERLCITLFPDDFSPVRAGGPKGDLKNDGYCPKRDMYIAAHATRGETFASTKLKIKSDLEGCIKNHKTLKKWVYLTNDVLAGDIQKFVEDQRAIYSKIEIAIWDPKIITNKILALDEQSINYIIGFDISTDIEKIYKLLELKEVGSKETASSVQVDDVRDIKNISIKAEETIKNSKSKDYQKIITLYAQGYTKENFIECKKILYSSLDSEAILQAYLLLASWYDYSPETVEDQNTLLDIGIATAKDQKALDAEAILLATKGMNVSTQFVLMDLEGWGQVEMGNRIGLPIITPDKQSEIVRKLDILDAQFKELFKVAIGKSIESNNHLILSRVLSMVGSAAGGRALHFLTLNINDRAEIEKKLCKGCFMIAKNVLVKAQDQAELAFLLHNFANALRGIGETKEALDLVEKSIEIATEYKIPDFMDKAEKLKEIILHPVEIPKME